MQLVPRNSWDCPRSAKQPCLFVKEVLFSSRESCRRQLIPASDAGNSTLPVGYADSRHPSRRLQTPNYGLPELRGSPQLSGTGHS
jgi:hypothetical protein